MKERDRSGGSFCRGIRRGTRSCSSSRNLLLVHYHRMVLSHVAPGARCCHVRNDNGDSAENGLVRKSGWTNLIPGAIGAGGRLVACGLRRKAKGVRSRGGRVGAPLASPGPPWLRQSGAKPRTPHPEREQLARVPDQRARERDALSLFH